MKRFTQFTIGRSAVMVMVLVAVFVFAAGVQAGKIIDHPDKLKLKDLNYKPPKQ